MSNKRKTLKALADFFSSIPKWMKDKAEPFGPIEPLKPEPLTPVKPANPPIEPPRPVEYDK
jgi:hypothetical protein